MRFTAAAIFLVYVGGLALSVRELNYGSISLCTFFICYSWHILWRERG